jgi:hypothetical protein
MTDIIRSRPRGDTPRRWSDLIHILIAVAAIFLSGCASFLDGKIYSLERAIVLSMKIEVTHGGGQISASDPQTGEQFQGTYVGIRDSSVAAAFAGSSPAFAVGSRNQVPAMATMIGDKGTVLDCRMLIQAGWRPRGMGTCTDNKEGRYSLQF